VDSRLYKDMNTKYFHMLAKIRQNKKKSTAINDNLGNWIHEDKAILGCFLDYFSSLFCTKTKSSKYREVKGNRNTIALTPTVDQYEIKMAIFQMNSFEAPGPMESNLSSIKNIGIGPQTV